MSSVRRFIRLLLAVSLALTAGVAWAQWNLPPDYSKDNDAQNPKDMRGGKGQGMRLLYYENFEGESIRTTEGWGTMPKSWSQEWIAGTTGGSNTTAYWVVEPGGGRPDTSASRTPYRPYDGVGNMLCYVNSTGAMERLVTPELNLSGGDISDPRLVFYYASPKDYRGFCRMKIQYRFSKGEWKDLADVEEFQRADDWVPVSIPLPPALREKGGLQIGFVSVQNYGFGTAIDEVYVVNMDGAETGVRTFDFTPQSPIIARGAKNVPLMRMDVTLTSGGGKLKLEGFNGKEEQTSPSVEVHAADGSGQPLMKDALSNFRVFVGRGGKFSDAVEAAKLNVSGGAGTFELKTFNITDHKALIMQGGNTYNVWIVADVNDVESTPYKTRIGVDVKESTIKFVWYKNDEDPTSLNGPKQSFYPAKGYSYKTPEVQRSVVYKSLFFDDFEAGLGKWNRLSGATQQLWALGNPKVGQGVTFPSGGKPREEQVKSAYSGDKVLATGELATGGELRARYFASMVSANNQIQCAWVEIKDKIQASQVKDVYLVMQKSFNTPSGMLLFVEGKYEGSTTWVEFARYNVSSSDWQGWQELPLRLSRADGREFNLRLRAFYPKSDLAHTGFIIDDLRILGNEVQNDVGITGLKVTESWENGKGRKAAFTVRNYGVNTQKDIKYDVYVDGNLALGGQSLPEGDLAAGKSQNVETAELEALKADLNRDNTHEIEVRLTLSSDEDMSNNVARVTTYSYPTITVSDAKPYPETFGDPMRHWFGGEAYREGFKSSWLFNSVYSISKCRDNSGKQAGPFGEGMLLGSYIWTTGDHTAFGFEQSVLTSPVFEISTQDAKNRKEFVMAYTTQGENVEVQVEYRKENEDWQRLEKSAQWEKGWYDGSGAVWKGSTTEGYKIVKTLLPDDLQGVGGAVKAQFRVYFYNRSADRVPGIAVNGIEVRSVRSDIYVKPIEPKGGCGNPLGNDETLRVTIAVNAEPAIAYGARKDFPVSIKVVSEGKTYSVVKPVELPALDPGQSHTVDTEVQLPWAAEWGKKSEVTVTLLPQSGKNGEADEDVSNNVLTQTIEAKVPAVFPLKEIVKEEGGYVLYALIGNGLMLQTEPEQGSGYNGYIFSDFSISEGGAHAAISNGTFTASSVGSIKLKYTVNGKCDEELPIEIKKAQCDVTVVSVKPDGDVNCKDEGEALTFKVTIEDNIQPSVAQNLRLVVTQGGREVYSGDAKLGEQTVEVTKARSGGGVLKFTAVADADMDGSNNTKVYEPEVLLYPKPLEVFLQDVSDPTYMQRVDDRSDQNTYGNRQWQLYVPKVSVIPEIKWTHRGYTMSSDENGYIVRLGQASGEFVALATLSNGTDQCPEKKVFSVNVKNEDVEVQSLGGGTGAPGLCADAQGEYEVYVSLMNHSWVSYSPETWMGFELSGPNGEHATTVQVQLTDEWQPKVLLLLPLGKLPKELKDLAVGNAVSLKVKYLGVYDADKLELTPDANEANNEVVTELKLSSAPKVQWDGIEMDPTSKEYLVRKVFKDVPTVTGTLKVKGGDPAGMHYAWYSKSKRADAWTLQEGGVQGPGVYNITGIADDCYKVEVTNQAGCRSELEMRYIQTDLGFTSGRVMETPTVSCSLTDNDGNVRLIFKNTGSKPLTSEEKFRVTLGVEGLNGLNTYTSDVMWFSPELEVNESRSELIKIPNLSSLIAEIQERADNTSNGKAKLNFYDIMLKEEGGWSVSGADDERKEVAGVTVEEWGAPRPTVKLYSGVSGAELFQGGNVNTKAKLVGPKEGFRRGQVEGIDNTYGDLVGHVSKARGEKAQWLWHYTYTKFNKWPDQKLDATVGDSVVSIPQTAQTKWMEENKNQVGTTPEGEPKRPDGTYTVVVTGAHECMSRVQFSVADKAYDLKLEAVRPPKDECDFKGKETKVTVTVRNAGTMPIDPDAEISLKLTREDVGVSTEAWAKAAYASFLGTPEGNPTNNSKHSIGKLNNGKALEPNGAVAIDVPVTLYYKAKDTKGVVRSLLDGVTFEYSAEVTFANGDFHEANVDNNKLATKVAVRDISSPVVTSFNLKHNSNSITFDGDRVFYQWDEAGMGGKPVGVTLGATTDNEGVSTGGGSTGGRTWYLRGDMHKNGAANITKITGPSATVDGYGSAELVVSNDGCEGTGVFTIVGSGAALIVDSIKGIPDELCPEQVAGKRKLTVKIVNPTPTPINIGEDGCGQGEKQEAAVTLELGGNAIKEIPPTRLEPATFFGAKKDLREGEKVNGVWQQGKVKFNGVGMSAFDTCVVTFDDVELDGTNLQPGMEGTITVSLKGGCVDKGTNDSKDKKVKVNKSPDLREVLKDSPLEKYALRGSAAAWGESWSSQQELQEEMEWGEKGASPAIVRATVEQSGTDNKYKLKLSAAKPGTYVLKVTDKAKGCASSKEVEVQMPGFLTLAEGDAITLEPKDLLTGSCKYDKAAQALKVKVVNNGNEPLKLADKRTSIRLACSKNGAVEQKTSLDYTFKGAAALGVGEEMEIDVSVPFKGVDFSGDGVYDLNFVLQQGITDPVDGAPDELRSINPKNLTVKRYYQPTAKPDLVEQVKKAWGGQSVDFKALPKDKKVLMLYGLAKDPRLMNGRPTSEEYNTLQKNGTMWTWYVDGEQVLGPAPIAYEKKFVIPQPDGIVKVVMQTKDGCSLESDEVEMRRLKEFKFGAVRLGKMSNSKCAEESSVDGTKQEVTGSLKLEMADVPLAAGTKIELSCAYTQGSPDEKKEDDVSIVLDKEYKAGDLIPFKIMLPFKVGTNSVEVLGGKYVEPYSKNPSPIGRSTTREIFNVLAYPTLQSEIKKEQKAYASPYSIEFPAVEPRNEVKYQWESNSWSESPDFSVEKSGGYRVWIKRDNGCILEGNVRVDFYFKYNLTLGAGGSVRVIDAETGEDYKQGEQVIKDGAKVKIEPVANSGYHVLGAKVNGDVFNLGSVYPVLDNFKVEVLFEKDDNPTPPGPNAVESELLREVVAVNPFTGVLRLYGAEDVESYAVYNQLGNEVLRGVNASGGNVLDIDAVQLHEGVYVVRLRDSLGGERVLRVVKVRR